MPCLTVTAAVEPFLLNKLNIGFLKRQNPSTSDFLRKDMWLEKYSTPPVLSAAASNDLGGVAWAMEHEGCPVDVSGDWYAL
jgi:hypothetical protein